MSPSQDPAPNPAIDVAPQPKRIILPHRSKPEMETKTKRTADQSASPKSQKKSKKGQRLDLKTLLHDTHDESLDVNADDQPDKVEVISANLSIQSNERAEKKQNTKSDQTSKGTGNVLAKVKDERALAQTTIGYTEQDDDGNEEEVDSDDDDDDGDLDSDAYDDEDTFTMPRNISTQSRRCGKGGFWKQPLPRKGLVGAIDGPLARPESKESRKARLQEAEEHRRTLRERQQANAGAEAGRGHGRLLGAGPGQWDRAAGGGRADRQV